MYNIYNTYNIEMCKIQNLELLFESIYTIWNYLIEVATNTISRSKGGLSKLYNQK